VTPWQTNRHLVENVARLASLDCSVLDVTCGYGAFWTR